MQTGKTPNKDTFHAVRGFDCGLELWQSLYTDHIDVCMILKTGGEKSNLYEKSRYSLFTGGYFANAKNTER